MKAKIKSNVITGLILIIIVTVILCLNAFVVKLVRVDGFSMYPTYKSGALVLASLRSEEYRHGDVIVFEASDGNIYIKRIIAVESDEIFVDTMEQNVSVNGVKENEDYVFYNSMDMSLGVYYEYPVIRLTVPKNAFFVMGDNRMNSYDSRNSEIGVIYTEQIIGKVI